MKAIAIEKFGGAEVLKLMDFAKPEPEAEEVLIAIKAAGVNPVDWKIREGLLKGRLPHRFPITLGWDLAGIVEKLGAGVRDLQVGQEVFAYARGDTIHKGTYAQYITLNPRHLAAKPKNLSFEEAAAVPLAALTAYQALTESIALQSGETILIHAGAGGVGGYAIQLAKIAGARVLTTASPNHHDYVKELGADEVIDYKATDFCQAVQKKHPEGVDAVFDTVGGDTQTKSTKILKKGGRLTSILAIQDPLKENKNIKLGYVFVRPEAMQLAKIKNWIEEEKVQVHLAATFPLAEAAQALAMSQTGHTAGKIVLQI